MPARIDNHGRRRGRRGSGRGSGTRGRGGNGGSSHDRNDREGRRRGRGRGALVAVASEESEALVEPAAQIGVPVASTGPSRLFVVPAGLEDASSNGRGVRRLRESVSSETDQPPSTRSRTRAHP